MKPYPDVSQNHRQGEEEQTQQGTPGACPNAALVHLAITGFDPEPSSIRFANPTGAAGLKAPKRIHERASAVPAPLAGEVAARHADLDRGRLPVLRGFGCLQRVGRPAALLPRRQRTGARSRFAVGRFSTSPDHRHQERTSGSLQVANHRHAVKPAIQKQEPAFYAFGASHSKQTLHHILHRLAILYRRQGDGETMPLADYVTSRIGMKMARAALGLTAVDLVGVVLRLAVIGNQRQIDRQRLRTSPERLGKTIGQGGVHSLLEFVVLRQGCHQRVEHGLLCWRVCYVPAGGENGADPGSCEEQDAQQNRRPTFVSTILQPNMLLDHGRSPIVDFAAANRTMVLP